MKQFTGHKTKRQLVAHGYYSSIVGRRTKIPSIFRWMSGIFLLYCRRFMYLFHDFFAQHCLGKTVLDFTISQLPKNSRC